jgi:hypothetical protein
MKVEVKDLVMNGLRFHTNRALYGGVTAVIKDALIDSSYEDVKQSTLHSLKGDI